MAELTSMRNIGKEIEKKLKSVGICSTEELKRAGSKEAFLHLKTRHPNVCLVNLYTLQGAIDDIEYNRLSEETSSPCHLKIYKTIG
jgi:DNA transformation protein